MFDRHAETKIVRMFISYYDPSDANSEPFDEWPPSSPEKEDASAHDGMQGQTEKNVQIEQEEDDYLLNPVPENEHVDIDEESIYLGEQSTYALVVTIISKNEIATSEVPISGSAREDAISGSSSEGPTSSSDVDSEHFQDVVSDFEEKEELVGKDLLSGHIPNVDYAKEDPPMKVGSMYPNMKEFKLALAQHAIEHEFEYNRENSDPIDTEHTVQGKEKTNVHEDYMLLHCARKRGIGKQPEGKPKAKKMNLVVHHDSLTMSTRSKLLEQTSPVLATRSKRRLSL